MKKLSHQICVRQVERLECCVHLQGLCKTQPTLVSDLVAVQTQATQRTVLLQKNKNTVDCSTSQRTCNCSSIVVL